MVKFFNASVAVVAVESASGLDYSAIEAEVLKVDAFIVCDSEELNDIELWHNKTWLLAGAQEVEKCSNDEKHVRSNTPSFEFTAIVSFWVRLKIVNLEEYLQKEYQDI